jgi:hypothetical protein
VAQHAAQFRRARVAATVALSVLLGIGTLAGTVAPAAATKPVAADFGPDCRQRPDAMARADELMAGTLRLSRHRPTRLPRNPTWAEDPFDDRNWEFQYHSLRFVWDLFEAWRMTRAADYRDRGLFLLRDWLRDNPPGAGRSGFSWNDHSTAIRTWVLACAAVVAPKAAWVRDALRIHGAVLADPAFYVDHGNHALNQSRGLLAAGCILGRRDWQRLAARRIASLLAESVDAQGVTNEQSIYYQLYNMEAYQAAADRLRACGMAVPRAFRRLDRMTDLLTHATLPDGTYASLGDTSHAPARSIRGTTAAYAATEGRMGPMPAARFVTFDAGFAFGRTGWGTARRFEDEIMWSARFGPGRAYHGHLDHGAVTLYGYGRRLVDDPGLFSANVNQWRKFAISRSAHNVITADRIDYTASSKATLTRSNTATTHDDITILDPGYRGVDLRRRIVFSKGLGWLLVDDHAASRSVRTYRQLWHLLPGADPRLAGTAVRTRFDGGNLAIFQLRVPDEVNVIEGRRTPLQGWYSTTLNRRKRAPTVEAVLSGRNVRYVTLLVPLPRPEARVRVSGVSVRGPNVWFTLNVDGRRERVEIGRRAVEVTTLRNVAPGGRGRHSS